MVNSLRTISDQQLLSSTDAIALQDRRVTITLLVHLHEIERRKLHLRRGFASMFDYCTTHLRYSEPAAARRLRTARCLARFPQLYELLEAGEVSLSTVSMVSKLMTPANAGRVLSRIRGKSRREVERVIAELDPRMTVPPDRIRTVVVPSAGVPVAVTVAGDSEKAPTLDAASPDDDPPGAEQGSCIPPANRTLEHRTVIQFAARDEFMAKMERARALVWHRLPNATFEQLFEMALDDLIARRDPVERQRRREHKAFAAVNSSAAGESARAGAVTANAGKRYIRAAVRDQVFARDGFRCAYIAPGGRRCAASVSLQVDHIQPVARGGANTVHNLRILCARHNRLEGERLTGHGELPGV